MLHIHKRGFASLPPERQREIARLGGQAAHRKGAAHEFTSEEARIAGRKGGCAVSKNRAHMAAIGRKGGQRRSTRAFPPAVFPSSESEPTDSPIGQNTPSPG
jgi:hypothetical protein